MSWRWPWERKEPKVSPPVPDLTEAVVADWAATAKLRDTKRTEVDMEAAARKAREVARRVDRFTAEMDGSFRRLGDGHG